MWDYDNHAGVYSIRESEVSLKAYYEAVHLMKNGWHCNFATRRQTARELDIPYEEAETTYFLIEEEYLEDTEDEYYTTVPTAEKLKMMWQV